MTTPYICPNGCKPEDTPCEYCPPLPGNVHKAARILAGPCKECDHRRGCMTHVGCKPFEDWNETERGSDARD